MSEPGQLPSLPDWVPPFRPRPPNSAIDRLERIGVPTLVIYALDDPFTPAEQYQRVDWESLPTLQPVITRTGGHCGFQAQGLKSSWHDHCIDRFVRRLVGKEG